ncbi:MAG: hypothetical protein GIKADHBN_01064 [Phycisphaerales bacterium]|nr:hypothetical protein [Phycisphaerales bacterium]
MNKNTVLYLALTVLSIVLCGLMIYPPERQLRLGKDLRGGVSLIYTVQLDPNDDAKETLAKTIEVVRERIDPDGLLEISIIAQGRDRIEITMPLPGPEVKKLRAAVEEELEKLQATSISAGALDSALRAPPAERPERLAKLAADDQKRLELLQKAAAAHDEAEARRQAYEASRAANEPEADQIKLLTQTTDAANAADAAREAVLRTSIAPEEVRRALRLPAVKPRLFDSQTGQSVEFDSPREEALKRLRDDHPEAVHRLDQVVAAHQAYMEKRTSVDDPQDLIRLMKGAGVLSFRITADPGWNPGEEVRLREELREKGPQNVRSSEMRWFKLNALDKWHDNDLARAKQMRENPQLYFEKMGYVVDEFDGEYYMLAWDTNDKRLTQEGESWAVSRAYEGADQYGKPAIHFEMNPRGAFRLGEMTKNNVSSRMAVLLDDQVYTAPTLQSEISRSGQITGNFSPEEIRYIARVLSAGSLQSKLSPEPISTSILGPELGADNLRLGMRAGLVAFGVVTVFMIGYYFTLGGIAIFALLVNALLILGSMASAKAAFTMPGIAGVILTFGQAIDANVLIYERMREEFRRGHDMRSAVRLGFDKAMSSIVDGNVTNFIVCLVLGYVGTAEVRGFAITMGIGIVATLFCTMVVSRGILDFAVHQIGWRRTSMLPMVVPALERALIWRVNWIRLRWFFVTVSTVLVGVGLAMFVFRGERMLDTEFLGGTQVTMQLRQAPDGSGPMTLTRPEAEKLVHAIGDRASGTDVLRPMQAAEVSPVNPREDGITSNQFLVKTTITDKDAVLGALTSAFGDYIESKPPLTFQGADAPDWRRSNITYRLLSPRLGDNIDRPTISDNVANRIGGVAILLEDVRNAQTGERPSREALMERLEKARAQTEFSDTLGRVRELRVLDGTDDAVVTAVFLVQDPAVSFLTNEARFDADVVAREWSLVNGALTRTLSPASVQSFSPAIAGTFKAQAIVAAALSFALISLYIWFRFKSGRYGFAAVVALVHDVLAVLGLLALCGWLVENPSTAAAAAQLGLLPFKIDLNMVAALLTVSGYSLNDTIIIMDRIRENRGKLPYTSATTINNAINQTISRTMITSSTTLMSSLTLYMFGGEGVRAFSFALTMGVIVGTYSSIAVAAPIIWSRREEARMAPGAMVPAPTTA